jgi:predicted transcriptional regulator
MLINLDPQKETRLQEIATRTGRTVEQIVDMAIDRVIKEHPLLPKNDLMTEEKRAAMMARIDEVRSLPRQSPDDGFDPKDHDKWIYRLE